MPTYTVRWEDKATGTPVLAVFQAPSEIGLFSPTGSWTARSIVLGSFNPTSDRISMYMSAGSGVFYIRRFRVTGSDGSIYYGAWPSTTAITYTAAHQDGAGGQDHIGRDTGTGADDNAFQFNLTSGTFEAAGSALDWYFAPLVGGWGVGQVRIA